MSRPGIWDQTGSVKVLGEQKLAVLRESEPILANHGRTEYVVIREYAILPANSIGSGKAILIAADPSVKCVGNVQIGVVNRIAPKDVSALT